MSVESMTLTKSDIDLSNMMSDIRIEELNLNNSDIQLSNSKT